MNNQCDIIVSTAADNFRVSAGSASGQELMNWKFGCCSVADVVSVEIDSETLCKVIRACKVSGLVCMMRD